MNVFRMVYVNFQNHLSVKGCHTLSGICMI